MSDLAQIRDGLVEAITSTLPEVNAYRLPVDNANVPAVIVAGFELQPMTVGNIGHTATVDLFVLVSRRNVDQVDLLDQLVDPNRTDSVLAAIQDDPTLGGRALSAAVQSVGGYREEESAGTGYYAATVSVEVMF